MFDKVGKCLLRTTQGTVMISGLYYGSNMHICIVLVGT
jgi:hypothetical protein